MRKREVELAGAQARQRFVRVGHRDVELDGRVALAEARDRERHDRRGRGRERRQPEPASVEARQLTQLLLRAREVDEDRLGPLDEQQTSVGQHRALGHAPYELCPDLAFERCDLARYGRLRVAERVGRRGERALAGDLHEHAEPPCVEHDV